MCQFSRPNSFPSDLDSLRIALRFLLFFLVIILFWQAFNMPNIQGLSDSGVEVLSLPLVVRLVEALSAVVAVGLVTLAYTVLIQRSSLMAITSLYPRRPIEVNMGRLLDAAWPETNISFNTTSPHKHESASKFFKNTIQLFYIGKMTGEPEEENVAKCRQESTATLKGLEKKRPIWLTSGSQLTKNLVQVMVWEWISLWLTLLMVLSTLLFNGFFTNDFTLDSFPRLTIVLIYMTSYFIHFVFTWIVSLEFFKLVFGGASWSLLGGSEFVIGDTMKLESHVPGTSFNFRSIDKSNEAYNPLQLKARLGKRTTLKVLETAESETTKLENEQHRFALATINTSSKTERETATESSRLALDRVIANSMVLMAVTLSSGFASWTSTQHTSETPNNMSANQIGSLALLGSLSIGAAAMFSSAMHLNAMKSSFRTILSLKEIKINGMAVDYIQASRSSDRKPISFTESGGVPLAEVKLADFFASNRSYGWLGYFGMAILGPGYALLPRLGDHERKSAEVEFEFTAPLSRGEVIVTTRRSDKHKCESEAANRNKVIACYRPVEPYGKETC